MEGIHFSCMDLEGCSHISAKHAESFVSPLPTTHASSFWACRPTVHHSRVANVGALINRVVFANTSPCKHRSQAHANAKSQPSTLPIAALIVGSWPIADSVAVKGPCIASYYNMHFPCYKLPGKDVQAACTRSFREQKFSYVYYYKLVHSISVSEPV